MTAEEDTALADKLVAAGIGRWAADKAHIWIPGGNQCLTVDEFVRDWRVAGACMDRMRYEFLTGDYSHLDNNGSLPRAICEAYINYFLEERK